ncbi:hypothetical protein PCE1_002102 [Barthelona sp. PCE]
MDFECQLKCVVVSEFDLDIGATIRSVYPSCEDVDECIADLALPDGAHNRKIDSTFGFLSRPESLSLPSIPASSSEESATNVFEVRVSKYLEGIDSWNSLSGDVLQLHVLEEERLMHAYQPGIEEPLFSIELHPLMTTEIISERFLSLNSKNGDIIGLNFSKTVSFMRFVVLLHSMLATGEGDLVYSVSYSFEHDDLHRGAIVKSLSLVGHFPKFFKREFIEKTLETILEQTFLLNMEASDDEQISDEELAKKTFDTVSQMVDKESKHDLGMQSLSVLFEHFGEPHLIATLVEMVLTNKSILFFSEDSASQICQCVMGLIYLLRPFYGILEQKAFPWVTVQTPDYILVSGAIVGTTNPLLALRNRHFQCVAKLAEGTVELVSETETVKSLFHPFFKLWQNASAEVVASEFHYFMDHHLYIASTLHLPRYAAFELPIVSLIQSHPFYPQWVAFKFYQLLHFPSVLLDTVFGLYSVSDHDDQGLLSALLCLKEGLDGGAFTASEFSTFTNNDFIPRLHPYLFHVNDEIHSLLKEILAEYFSIPQFYNHTRS